MGQLDFSQLPPVAENPDLALQAVLLSCREITPSKTPDKEWINKGVACLDSVDITTFIAVDGARVVATGGLDRSDPTDYEEASIIDLAVAQSRRYEGLGRGIVEMVEATARQEGIKNLYALSTMYAHGFYNRLGFLRVTGVDYVKSLR
ncbi:MAG TPA: GNAT family N-acetyltransferase [Patescibacteria group bacterium]|nr:GNAT family N-acetyltransferase [Patescibacteria group bacterium]